MFFFECTATGEVPCRLWFWDSAVAAGKALHSRKTCLTHCRLTASRVDYRPAREVNMEIPAL